MTIHAMAVDAFATRHRVSAKVVRDQLRLGEKADEIRAAWGEFGTYLAARPEAEQARILTALSPATPPAPTSAPPSTP